MYKVINKVNSEENSEITKMRKSLERNEFNQRTLQHWIDSKKTSKDFEKYFYYRNVKKVALYGMGTIGFLLKSYLDDINSIEVVYIVDNYTFTNLPTEFNAIHESRISEMETIDMMIVTIPHQYTAIRDSLEGKVNFDIISIITLIS